MPILHLRVSETVLVSADQLTARLQALTGERKITRERLLRTLLCVAENIEDPQLIECFPEGTPVHESPG